MSIKSDVIELNTIFKKPIITSYGFVRLLFAKLVLQLINMLDRNKITEAIYALSKKPEYKKLLSDIGFRVFIDSVSSQDIEDGISSLQTFGMIGKLNPFYDHIVIYIHQDMAKSIIGEYDPQISTLMDSFVTEFLREIKD